MKTWTTALLSLVLTVLTSPGFGQLSPHFYNVDTEKQFEGTIQEVRFEPRYEKSAAFLILILEEKKTGEQYKVEISPIWFFERDFHKGEKVKVIGSVYTQDETLNVIARQISFGGETFMLRDSRGFPNWRSGKMQGKGRREGRGI